MKIRPAELSELNQLSELCLRSKAMWGYDENFIAACRPFLSIYPDDLKKDCVMVAEQGGVTVGVVHLIVDAESAELEKLFVEPSQSGRGVGTRLLQWAKSHAVSLKVRKIHIISDPSAEAFYHSHGAVCVGSAPSEVDPDRPLPRMEITL